MRDVLEAYLSKPEGVKCAVGAWVAMQGDEEQKLIEAIKSRKDINLMKLYQDLGAETPLPFKITLFRMHMRGTCSCL